MIEPPRYPQDGWDNYPYEIVPDENVPDENVSEPLPSYKEPYAQQPDRMLDEDAANQYSNDGIGGYLSIRKGRLICRQEKLQCESQNPTFAASMLEQCLQRKSSEKWSSLQKSKDADALSIKLSYTCIESMTISHKLKLYKLCTDYSSKSILSIPKLSETVWRLHIDKMDTKSQLKFLNAAYGNIRRFVLYNFLKLDDLSPSQKVELIEAHVINWLLQEPPRYNDGDPDHTREQHRMSYWLNQHKFLHLLHLSDLNSEQKYTIFKRLMSSELLHPAVMELSMHTLDNKHVIKILKKTKSPAVNAVLVKALRIHERTPESRAKILKAVRRSSVYSLLRESSPVLRERSPPMPFFVRLLHTTA